MKKKSKTRVCDMQDCGMSGVVYILGVIGALVFYLSTATGFWNGVWGVIKGILWPAFLVFELLKFLGM